MRSLPAEAVPTGGVWGRCAFDDVMKAWLVRRPAQPLGQNTREDAPPVALYKPLPVLVLCTSTTPPQLLLPSTSSGVHWRRHDQDVASVCGTDMALAPQCVPSGGRNACAVCVANAGRCVRAPSDSFQDQSGATTASSSCEFSPEQETQNQNQIPFENYFS